MGLQTRRGIVGTFVLIVMITIGGVLWSKFPSARLIVALVLAAVIALEASLWIARRAAGSLERIAQAVKTVEAGEYKPELLAGLIQRKDEIGKLSRSLDAMASEVAARNRRLKLLLRVIPAGVALSLESDFHRLLEAIVVESQAITNADGGTLYMLENRKLKFVILRNTSLKTAMVGTTRTPISFPPVPMYDEKTGEPNHHNVASHAALGHEWVNIPDAYQAEGFDFSGTRAFDERTGYHSQSFLTIPLEGEEHQVIGVLQLINALDPETGAVVPFRADEVFETLVLLASTALAGYIRQEKLRKEIEKLNIQIDHAKKSRQVQEITETDYFRALLKKVRQLRSRKKNTID